MFVKMARRQTRLYDAVYGSDHLNERLNAIDRANEIHEECPEFTTVSFLSEMWERMISQYNAFVVEGIHFILATYDEGATFDKIKRYALAPDGKGGADWEFPPIFDFDNDSGFWKSVIIPEIRQERQRQGIHNLVAERCKTPMGRYRRNGDRVGGSDEAPKNPYPTGPNLTAVDRKIGIPHRPLDKAGVILRYNFSAHSGCQKGDYCQFPHAQRIRPDGLHWLCNSTWIDVVGCLLGKRLIRAQSMVICRQCL